MLTKQRILTEAIGLFNQSGYGPINFPDIAAALNMSRGNLAYHYRDKELILSAIGDQLEEDIRIERSKRKDYPAFANLQIDIKSYYLLQKKYQFIFENTTLLHQKNIRRVMMRWANKTIQDNIESFAFAIQIGNMKPEAYSGIYQNLAVNTWILTYFWLTQKEVRGIKHAEDAEKTVWSIIIPHFTERGIDSLKSYFGQDFLKNLGKPFDLKDKNVILF